MGRRRYLPLFLAGRTASREGHGPNNRLVRMITPSAAKRKPLLGRRPTGQRCRSAPAVSYGLAVPALPIRWLTPRSAARASTCGSMRTGPLTNSGRL